MKTSATYCEETGKFCYSSEAKASRAISRYTDIKRSYYCVFCHSWHTTSQANKRVEIEKVVPVSALQERLNKLVLKEERKAEKKRKKK